MNLGKSPPQRVQLLEQERKAVGSGLLPTTLAVQLVAHSLALPAFTFPDRALPLHSESRFFCGLVHPPKHEGSGLQEDCGTCRVQLALLRP